MIYLRHPQRRSSGSASLGSHAQTFGYGNGSRVCRHISVDDDVVSIIQLLGYLNLEDVDPADTHYVQILVDAPYFVLVDKHLRLGFVAVDARHWATSMEGNAGLR